MKHFLQTLMLVFVAIGGCDRQQEGAAIPLTEESILAELEGKGVLVVGEVVALTKFGASIETPAGVVVLRGWDSTFAKGNGQVVEVVGTLHWRPPFDVEPPEDGMPVPNPPPGHYDGWWELREFDEVATSSGK